MIRIHQLRIADYVILTPPFSVLWISNETEPSLNCLLFCFLFVLHSTDKWSTVLQYRLRTFRRISSIKQVRLHLRVQARKRQKANSAAERGRKQSKWLISQNRLLVKQRVAQSSRWQYNVHCFFFSFFSFFALLLHRLTAHRCSFILLPTFSYHGIFSKCS